MPDQPCPIPQVPEDSCSGKYSIPSGAGTAQQVDALVTHAQQAHVDWVKQRIKEALTRPTNP